MSSSDQLLTRPDYAAWYSDLRSAPVDEETNGLTVDKTRAKKIFLSRQVVELPDIRLCQ